MSCLCLFVHRIDSGVVGINVPVCRVELEYLPSIEYQMCALSVVVRVLPEAKRTKLHLSSQTYAAETRYVARS